MAISVSPFFALFSKRTLSWIFVNSRKKEVLQWLGIPSWLQKKRDKKTVWLARGIICLAERPAIDVDFFA